MWNLKNKNKVIDIGNKLVVARGGGEDWGMIGMVKGGHKLSHGYIIYSIVTIVNIVVLHICNLLRQ